MNTITNRFYLRLEAVPGMGLEDFARDACQLADRLGCAVVFEGNGTDLTASPGCDPEIVVEIWRAQFRTETHKPATQSALSRAANELRRIVNRPAREDTDPVDEVSADLQALLTVLIQAFEEARDA